MRKGFWGPVPFVLMILSVWLGIGCGRFDSSLNSPGTVFIHQKAGDFKAFRSAFLAQAQNLKAHGFTAYSLHRDLYDPNTYILVLQCSDLGDGVSFIRSPEYIAGIDKSEARIPTIWYGLDHNPRQFAAQPQMTGGIVIARNEIRDYAFWLKCFYAEDGGKHNHPGRKYKNSNYSIHHLLGDPAVAIVAHDASDVSKAPSFMVSDPMKYEMESTGVTGLEIWYGINLEEGFF